MVVGGRGEKLLLEFRCLIFTSCILYNVRIIVIVAEGYIRWVCARARVCVCVCVCIYIYIHTHTHTHTHTHILYGCETWSLTLREERRLRVFENRVLRRVFGPKRDEVTGEWRKLHNEDLSDLYFIPNIVRVVKSRRMRWAGHVVCMWVGRDVHRVLVGKPEGKRPLGRPRRRWEDNIKMGLRKWEGFEDWMELAQNRDRWQALVSTVRNLRVPKMRGFS